ncbi:GWxTD domain-containing protein [candidate division KSB1 bacterium]|nr:GWxTD domain-containing protein [candidate division KSB1 bacterium]
MNKIKLTFVVSILFLFVSEFCYAQESQTTTTVTITTTAIDSTALLKEKIQQQRKNLNLQLRLANIYLKNEKLDEAEKIYKSLTEDDSLAVKALTGYGEVYFKRTPSRIIPLERVKELLKIDYRSKAIKKFKQALAIDSSHLPARYFLARSYMRKTEKKSLENALNEFKKILGQDQGYRDITYQIGYSYQKMKVYDKALSFLNSITEEMGDYARTRIRMSEIYYETEKFEQSTVCYYQAMETLTDKEMLDYQFDEQKILLTKEEKAEFEAVSYDQKRYVFQRFWKSRDPDPSTVENERLTEHFRRVNFARFNFHFTAPPYYDDRGKIYIKYGEPDERYNSPLGNTLAKDNESWSYETITKGLVFDFVADGGYYKLAQDLTEAAPPGYSFDQRLALAAGLYMDRSHISDSYSMLTVSFSMDRLNDFQADQAEALNKYPGDIYAPKENKYTFPFISKWGQFKEKNEKTRLEFYTSFPGSALKLSTSNMPVTKYVDFFIEVDDTNFNAVISDKKRFAYNITSHEKLQNAQYVFQNTYSLSPGNYNVAFVISDVDVASKGVIRKDLIVRDYSGDKLLMSDLQISSNIKPASGKPNEAFVKNDLKVVPYTFTRVMRRNPIYLYFEIYNLSLDDQGLTNFEVAYSVETTKPKRSFWKTLGSIFTGGKKNTIATSTKRVGDTRNPFEYIALDLKNMENGETDLRVIITDLITQKNVERVIQVILID